MSLQAQSDANSPYSLYGLGDPVNRNFYHLQQMGSLGNSYADSYTINMVNPASYSRLKSTSFDIGLYAKRSVLEQENQEKADNWSGNLGYMALAFPLVNPLNRLLDREESNYNYGMGIALRPRSRVNYDISTTDSLSTAGTVSRRYVGSGGTYDVVVGGAFQYKALSVGANFGYMFGNIDYQRYADFIDLPSPYNNFFSTEYSVGGVVWDLGVMYEVILNKKEILEEVGVAKNSLMIGATLSTASSFNTNSTIRKFNIQAPQVDTTLYVQDQKGKGKLPGTIGMGVSYIHGRKYALGVDFESYTWSKYFNEANNEVAGDLNNGYKISAGGYFRPNYKSFKNYYKRIYYKFGALYEKDPRSINGEDIDNIAVTFGLGLPFVFQRKLSHANLGLELGRRGNKTPIKENYLTITASFNFGDDEWFVKSKYN